LLLVFSWRNAFYMFFLSLSLLISFCLKPTILLLGRHEMTLKQYEVCFVVDAPPSSSQSLDKDDEHPEGEDEDSEDMEDAEEPHLPLNSLECVLSVKSEPGLEEEPRPVAARPKPVRLEARERPGPLSALQRAALETARFGSPVSSPQARSAADDKPDPTAPPRMVWVPWFESKLTSCFICGETRTCGLSFKNHLYDRHKYMSRKEYMRRFPEADIEPAQWRCPICRNSVKWTKKCIVDHLRAAHSLTRERFEEAYGIEPRHLVRSPNGDGGAALNARTDVGQANRASGDSTESTAAGGGSSDGPAAGGCSLCEEPVEAANFPEHISDYHKMSREAYLKLCPADAAKFVISAASLTAQSAAAAATKWICRICDEDVDQAGDKIERHLDTHGIELEDYQRIYKDGEEEEEGGDCEDLEDPSGLLLIEEGDPDQDIHQEEDPDQLVEDGLRGHSIFDAADEDYGGSSAGEVQTAVKESSLLPAIPPWYEAVKIRCEECHNELWLGAFMKHIILTHKLPIKAGLEKTG
jgi:hypothetical protein